MPLFDSIHVLRTPGETARAAANRVAELAAESIVHRKRFTAALSGGTTPETLYYELRARSPDTIDWERVHIFWGDERYVPPDDPRSNFRMAQRSLLNSVPIPPANVHPMPTQFPHPGDGAARYEETLRSYFQQPFPNFDLVLLGLGADGHFASLFPGSPGLEERKRWVIAVQALADPPVRLSLTLPVIEHARNIVFLVTGTQKNAIMRLILQGTQPGEKAIPLFLMRPSGHIEWFIDEAAGKGIGRFVL